MQKILTFFIFILLIYSIVKSKIIDNDSVKNLFNMMGSPNEAVVDKNSEAPKSAPVELKGNFIERSISNIAANVLKTPQGKNFFNKLIQPQYEMSDNIGMVIKGNNNEAIRSLFMITDIKEGLGEALCCGQKAKVSYTIYNDKGESTSLTKDIVVGSSDLAPNFDSVIVGMSKNSQRSAVLKNIRELENQMDNEDNQIPQSQVDATILELYPNNFDVFKILIFDDSYGYTTPILCGDNISLKIKIKTLDNKQLYNSDKILFTVGQLNTEWPEFFSYVLYNKILPGSRFAIVPTSYILGVAKRLSLNLENESYVIIEFYDTKLESKK